MKRLIIILFVIVSSVSNAQYKPMLNDGAEWFYYHKSWDQANRHYNIEEDTTINGKLYKILIDDMFDEYDNYFAEYYVREDSVEKKVYIHDLGILSSNETVLYDFNLIAGDTFEYITNTSPYFSYKMILDSISNDPNFLPLNMNDDTLFLTDSIKVFKFTPLYTSSLYPVYWIEGIGNISELNHSVAYHSQNHLICHYQNDSIKDYSLRLYNNPFNDDCKIEVIFGAIEDYNSINITIQPNPFTSTFQIKTSYQEQSSIVLYDILGKQLEVPYSSSNGVIEVDGSNLESGVYIIALLGNKGEVISRSKIVKR